MCCRDQRMLLLMLLGVCMAIQYTNAGETDYKRVCYYTGWAQYRLQPYQFFPEDVDADLCTHIIYSFYLFNMDTWTLRPDELNAPDMLRRLTALRTKNPDLKIMIAVGGYTFGSSAFSSMSSTPANREAFITNTLGTLEEYDLDGVDIDWEYPTLRGGRPQDKDNLVALLEEMKEAFESEGYILSIAVPAGQQIIHSGYDHRMAQHLDFINVMAYDYHGSWETVTGFNAPVHQLENTTQPESSVYATLGLYINDLGIPREKLILGMATYGRTWTLTNAPAQTGPGSPGVPGPYTKYMGQPGFTSYYEICLHGTLSPVWNDVTKVPYVVVDNNVWVSYDNQKSLKVKTDIVMTEGLGGAMFWALDLDDFKGSCGGGDYPLIGYVKRLLEGDAPPTAATTTTTPTTTSTTATPTPATATFTHTATTSSTTMASTATVTTNAVSESTTTTATTSTSIPQSLACLLETDNHYRGQAGYYSNPNDCTQFRYCYGHALYICFPYVTCPPYTAWDFSILTCNHVHLVPCRCSSTIQA